MIVKRDLGTSEQFEMVDPIKSFTSNRSKMMIRMRNEKIELIRTLDFLQVMAFALEISFEEISET
jgi:hypothetical protein